MFFDGSLERLRLWAFESPPHPNNCQDKDSGSIPCPIILIFGHFAFLTEKGGQGASEERLLSCMDRSFDVR